MFIAVNSARQLSIVLSHVESYSSVASSGCNTWIWTNPQIEDSYSLAYHQARHILRPSLSSQSPQLSTHCVQSTHAYNLPKKYAIQFAFTIIVRKPKILH